MPLDPELRAPSAWMMALEARAVAEAAAFRLRRRALLASLPRGQGQAAMVLPGFGSTDRMLAPLVTLLNDLGFSACGWGLQRNLGMRSGVKEHLVARLRALHDRHGAVTMVGWSLGGVFAREIARSHPQGIRRVISLGSPINGHPEANNMMPLFRLANRGRAPKTDLAGFARRIVAPAVPCTAVYSQGDGIVRWQGCVEDPAENTENIEVRGSHFGLPFNAQVARIIAERLI